MTISTLTPEVKHSMIPHRNKNMIVMGLLMAAPDQKFLLFLETKLYPNLACRIYGHLYLSAFFRTSLFVADHLNSDPSKAVNSCEMVFHPGALFAIVNFCDSSDAAIEERIV